MYRVDFFDLTKAAEEHVRVVETCLRLANRAGTAPFFLASSLAVFDRSWTTLQFRVEANQERQRTLQVQSTANALAATSCFQFMKAAARSEFAGDLITARAWVLATRRTEKDVRSVDNIDLGNIRSPELIDLSASLHDNNEQSTKKLREAIAQAQKLRWRFNAFHYSSSGNVSRAENMAQCAEAVALCLHARLTMQDNAVITLLEAAIAAAQPCLQRYYENDEVEVPSTLITEISRYSACAAGIPSFRSATDDCLRELDELVARRDQYRSSSLTGLYDNLVAASQVEISLRVEHLANLEAGQPLTDCSCGDYANLKRVLREKLSICEPVVKQLSEVADKIAELQKSSDELSLLELRCWTGVVESVNTDMDQLINEPYNENSKRRAVLPLLCMGAELRVMVVESLVAAAKQYQREIRTEWRASVRSEVARLLGQAALWATECAKKTLKSIELNLAVGGTADARWRVHYHEATDRCAQLYARAAAERRASYHATVTGDKLGCALYHMASEASEREAYSVSQRDVVPPEDRFPLECRMDEIHKQCAAVAAIVVGECDRDMADVYCEWARKSLQGANDQFSWFITRQAYGVLVGSGTPEERAALSTYLHYRRNWLLSAREGVDRIRSRNLRAVLDQFEYSTRKLYDARSIVLGAAVGAKFADAVLPSEAIAVEVLRAEDRAKVQDDLNTVVRLAQHGLEISAVPALLMFPAELADTRASLNRAMCAAYERMSIALCIAEDPDAAPFQGDSETPVCEFKVRVLLLLPGLVGSFAQRAWEVFHRVGVDRPAAVIPDEYEVAIGALRTFDRDRLDAVINLRRAEAALWRDKECGQHCAETVKRMKWQVLDLDVRRAQLKLAVLQATRRGDRKALECLQEARRCAHKAATIAQ
jgi:hypothetical protein